MKSQIFKVLFFTSLLVGCACEAGYCLKSQRGNYLSVDSNGKVSSSYSCGDMEKWNWCKYNNGAYYGIWHIASSQSSDPSSNPHVFLMGTSDYKLDLLEISKLELQKNQEWVPIKNGDGTQSFQHKESGKYLTAEYSGIAGLSDTIGRDQKFQVQWQY